MSSSASQSASTANGGNIGSNTGTGGVTFWIVGGVVAVALIGGVVLYFKRKK